MGRRERSIEIKHNGNNCAQAVLLAFADVLELSETQLRQLGAAFGSGMGYMEGTCGALCGAGMVLGLKQYTGKHMGKDAAALHRAFTERCGASLCKDLKGRDTGRVVCSCDDCVGNAVEILEEMGIG